MLIYVALLIYLGRVSPSSAAPVTIQNTTALFGEKAPACQPDPPGRGTWSLLYSCVFSLALCIWNALHLNVPLSNESSWIGLRRKVKWVLIALFAPEIVLSVAFQQWLVAITFMWEMKRIAADSLERVAEVSSRLQDFLAWLTPSPAIEAHSEKEASQSSSMEKTNLLRLPSMRTLPSISSTPIM
jgi:hypothetical protein